MTKKKVEDMVLDNPVEEEVVVEDAPVAEEEAPVAPKSKSKALSVLDANGNFVREYSEEVHGKDFAVLAAQFIADRPGYSTK